MGNLASNSRPSIPGMLDVRKDRDERGLDILGKPIQCLLA
jgi:hypothetical protein